MLASAEKAARLARSIVTLPSAASVEGMKPPPPFSAASGVVASSDSTTSRPLASRPSLAERSTRPGGGARSPSIGSATSSAEPLSVAVAWGLRRKARRRRLHIEPQVAPRDAAREIAQRPRFTGLHIGGGIELVGRGVVARRGIDAVPGPTFSVPCFTTSRPASSNVASPVRVAGARSRRAIGLSGRPGPTRAQLQRDRGRRAVAMPAHAAV